MVTARWKALLMATSLADSSFPAALSPNRTPAFEFCRKKRYSIQSGPELMSVPRWSSVNS